MTTIEQVNKKINILIEWILNDHPFINRQKKLEDLLVADLKYYKDSHGNTLRIEVID